MMDNIMMTNTMLWIILFFVVLIIFFILTLGKSELGSEDDIWTATELCDKLSVSMKVPTEELMAMWGNPLKHKILAQQADELIESVHRRWMITENSDSKTTVSVKVEITWTTGQHTIISGNPTWDELPHKVRSHFIKTSDPISFTMQLPFKNTTYQTYN